MSSSKSNPTSNLLPFGLQSFSSGGRPDLMTDLLYSMGQSVFNRDGWQSIYQGMMNKNLQAGLPAFTGFPAGWGDGSGGNGTATETDPKKKNPLKGMPQWYQNWYNTQGLTGGLLDG